MDNLNKYIFSKLAASPAETLVEQQQLQGLTSNSLNPAGAEAVAWMKETGGKISIADWIRQRTLKSTPKPLPIQPAPIEALRTTSSGEFIPLPAKPIKGTSL